MTKQVAKLGIESSSPSVWRWLAFTLLLIVTISLGIAYKLRGSDLERASKELIDAFSKQRLIEPRLSGGFKGGEFKSPSDEISGSATLQLERARELITDAVARGDSSAELLYARLLVSRNERLPEALLYVRRALERAPESPEAHNDLGVCLIQQGKLEDAIDEFDAALTHRPNMPEALFNRALCYHRLLLREAASADYSRLLSCEKSPSWLAEIKRRQEEVSRPLAPQKKEVEIVAAFDAALSRRDVDEAKRLQDENCETIVKSTYTKRAPNYLREWAAGDYEKAEGTLFEIELIGKHFVESRQDTCLIDLANYLRNLEPGERQNELMLMVECTEGLGKLKSNEAKDACQRLTREFAARGNDAFQYFSIYTNAIFEYYAGNLETSIDILRTAQAIIEKHRWPYHRANLMAQLAIAHSLLGRESAAVKYCEQALESTQNMRVVQAKAWQYLANAQRHLGQLDRSLESLRASTRLLLDSVPTLSELANNYLDIAVLYRLRGNQHLALQYASESLNYSDRGNDNNRAAEASSFTGGEYARLKQLDQAAQFRDRAFEYLGRIDGKNRNLAKLFVLTCAAEIAEARGDHLTAVHLYSDAAAVLENKEGNTLSLIKVLQSRAEAYSQASEFEKSRLDLRRAITLIEGYRASIDDRESRISFLDVSQRAFDQMIALEIRAFKRSSEAFNFSEQSRARTLLEDFSAQQNASTINKQAKFLTIEGVQKALPDQLRILSYSVTSAGTYVFLITKSNIEVAELQPTTESLDRLVTDYTSSLKEKAPLDEVNEKAKVLYEILIGPVQNRIRDGKTLCIVPDKALHFLSFAALVDPAGKYLFESCCVTYAPSASALAVCIDETRQKSARKPESILAVGNPYFNRDQFQKLNNLPDAEREARESAAFYSTRTILIGQEATEDRVTNALKNCNVAHIAAHCLVQEKSPWLAALVLGGKNPTGGTRGSLESSPEDGLLQLSEIYRISLPSTRLVILSACQSGLGQYFRGEGLVSLVRPFMAMGVPTVVASLWSVDSQATCTLMIEFHRARKMDGKTTGDAMREAQAKMVHSTDFQHPYYWAPFIAVGSNN